MLLKQSIVVSGGGTGGHVFPALEIIKVIREKNPHIEVIWVGHPESLEEKTALANDISFLPIKVNKIIGQSKYQQILAAMALVKAIIVAYRHLLKLKPQAVIGVGGYVSAPILMAAFLLNIKRYIAEQNVIPGLANKYLGKIAHHIFINFNESKPYFPPLKTIVSGNPIRKAFFTIKRQPKSSFNILITGGSLGANFLNINIPKAIKAITKECPNLMITHQSGVNMKEEVEQNYRLMGINALVIDFIKDMPQAFSENDLIISRAGASIISEITAAAMPSILIPYPYASGHQQHNAMVLVKHKAALMILEEDNFITNLSSNILKLYHDQELLRTMANNAKNLAKPDAAHKIVDIILRHIN